MELKFKVNPAALHKPDVNAIAQLQLEFSLILSVNFSLLLQLNEEFDETTPDGRDVKAIVKFEVGDAGGSEIF